jgi:hypothetical protein
MALSKQLPAAFEANGFPLVEFDRKPVDQHPIRGFALAWNTDLTLVHLIEEHRFHLNGYAVFRNKDVRRWREITPGRFLARSAKPLKLSPSMPEGVAITSMKHAAASAGAAFPLITLHRERINRGVCYIGKVLRTSQRTVTVLPIDPQAEWDKAENHRLAEITRLEFGGAYEDLLFRLADKKK